MKPSAIPQCPNAEAALVGCAIAEPSRAPELSLDWFHDERFLAIASTLAGLYREGTRIDEAVVRQRCGPYLSDAIETAVDACFSAQNWDYWRAVASDFAMLRRALEVCRRNGVAVRDLPSSAGPEEVRSVISALERDVLAIRGASTDDRESGVGAAIGRLFDRLETGARPPLIRTGLCSVDAKTRIRPGQLFVVGARPSVGKTALACRIVETVAGIDGMGVGYLTLEIPSDEITQRLAASLAQVAFRDIDDGNLDDREKSRVEEALRAIQGWPLLFCDRSGIPMTHVESLARRWTTRHDIKLLVVDHLGLIGMEKHHRSRYDLVTDSSIRLKTLARELDICVLALSQLNRATAGKDGDPPGLHHLRESGSIEQDADIVGLLHETAVEGSRRRISFLIEKQRNGPLGEAPLILDGPTMRFESVSPIDPSDIPTP